MNDYTKHLIGLSGEYHVAKILCEHKWVPTLANNNCPVFDIFCHHPENQKTITIQVKTIKDRSNKKNNSFPVMGNRDKRDEFYRSITGPYVFVHIDIANRYRCFVLSKEQFILISSKIENDYDNLDRKKPLQPGSPMAIPMKIIESDYEDKWDNLWL